MIKQLRILFFLIITIFLLQGTSESAKQEYTTRVWKIQDNGVIVATDGERYCLFPLHIPSKKSFQVSLQTIAKEAHEYLENMMHGKTIHIQIDGKVRRRKSGVKPVLITLDDGTSMNGEVLTRGFATVDKQEVLRSTNKEYYLSLEHQVKKEKVGIWAHSMRYLDIPSTNKKLESTSSANPNRKLIQ